ncbi:Ig-like domain-containing protein [Fictibacillus sp. S7]|uniref:Ig-like domain-containing protein n=1 Tax=Fictibacillus sp. S7 TaxID=2212476 RepID=UPI0010129C97|nr:Ig-like domain-containing protein [Fictibacillus sp. S7]RXY98429.1 hypothetical protein DMO16_01390 [Fictibacillus sp. S7]
MKKKIAGLVLSSALLASTLGVSSAHAASAPTYSDTKQELKVAVKNSGHHTERFSHPLFTTKAKSQAMKMLKAGDIYYENEPNNDLSSADLLNSGEYVVGSFYDYDVDIFGFDIKTPGYLSAAALPVDYPYSLMDLGYGMIDTKKNFLPIDYLEVTNEGIIGEGYDVKKAGHYYLVALDLANFGSGDEYMLSYRFTPYDKTAPKAPTVNTVDDNDTVVKGKAEAKSTVEISVNKKSIGKATADKNGNFTVKIAKQKAGTSLSVTATDAAKNKSKVTVKKVIDKTAPSLTVNKVDDNDKSVSGKTEKNASVVVKYGSTKLGSKKAGSDGKFKITIKKQKKGRVLSVTSTDAAKNTKTVKVTVQKAK